MPRLQTFEKEVFDAADVEDEDLLGICNTIMPKQRLVIDTDPVRLLNPTPSHT